MVWPFTNKTSKLEISGEEFMLTLDIGTEYVKSIIYRIRDLRAEVIGYSRVRQHANAMSGAMIVNIEHVCSACDRGIREAMLVAEKILTYPPQYPKLVTMGISGEIVKGVSITANYEREESDIPINQKEIDTVVQSVKSEAFPESLNEIAEEIGTSPNKIKEISSHINSTYIDGLKVDSPIGFTGEEVSYKVFSTFAPSLHINTLYHIADQLELQILTIEVQPYAISKTLRGAGKQEFSSIFIDIGGGTTDIAVVDKGGIVGTRMFAFGGRVFTKRLAKEMGVDMEEAEQLKLDYSSGKLHDATAKKVSSLLSRDAELWAEGVEIALQEFEGVESFPSDILISGGGCDLPEIKSALLAHPWIAVLPFSRSPQIKHIFPGQIENIEDKTGMMIASIDVAPAALTSITCEILS